MFDSISTIATSSIIMIMVVCGVIMIFECAASKYLVRPAPDEGMFILLSFLLMA